MSGGAEHAAEVRPARRRGALAADVGRGGPLQRRPRPGADAVRRLPPAAQRHRATCTRVTRCKLSVGDPLIRLKRMQGFNTLFQPGYDHAGISTQNVVEKALDRGGHLAAGARPRSLRGARLGVAARVRRQDPRPVPAHGRVARLPPHAVHDGRRLHPRGACGSSCICTAAAGSTARIGSSTGARTTRRRSPTSSSSTRTSTTRCRRSAIRSPTATATSRSRRCGRRRSRPTSRSPCIPTTSATGTWSGAR